MSTTVERVMEFCKTHHDNVLVGINHRRWMLIEEELLSFLDSLSQERCVWKMEVDVGCQTSCDNYCCYCPDTDWIYCPYCGGKLEVKEADNG